jgi:hypothetical protein
MRNAILLVVLLGIFSIGVVNADQPSVDPNSLLPVTDNLVHFPGFYSYQAPTGWSVKLRAGGNSTACDLVGDHDFVAMISASVIFHNSSLRKFAEFCMAGEKRIIDEDVQMGELEDYTTPSGWGGLKLVETRTRNGHSSQYTFYFFSGSDDNKIELSTTCHSESLEHYTPIFDEAVKTFTRG